MKILVVILFLISQLCLLAGAAPQKNILLIMADDFNYWNGINGYYPQAKTPNIDRLARMGVLFNNAHSPSPACNPSRNAMWSGVSPMVSGIDTNSGLRFIREVEGFEDVITMKQYFKEQGCYAFGGGKLGHPSRMGKDNPKIDPANWTEINETNTESQGGATYRFESEEQSNVVRSAGPQLSGDTSGDYKLANDVKRFLREYNSKGFPAKGYGECDALLPRDLQKEKMVAGNPCLSGILCPG